MYYGPHTLEVKRKVETRDEFNRTVVVDECWMPLGSCRCDDSTTREIVDSNGKAFIPKYHIVADRLPVNTGDYVRALLGDEVRGEGEVKRVIRTNFLDYMSIYV